MSAPDGNREAPQRDDAGVVIRAVAYRPQPEARDAGRRLNPLRAALALIGLVVALVFWFLFTASAVRLEFDPGTARAHVAGGIAVPFGDVWLMRPGRYELTASAQGHAPFAAELVVEDARNQTHRFVLARLPGRVTFESTPPGADVVLGERMLGTTPLADVPLEAGPVAVRFDLPRYQPLTVEADITGMEQAQTVLGELVPDWAEVNVRSIPPGAEILLDDDPTGLTTPATVEVPTGEHELQVRAPGHKAHRQRILVAALEQIDLPEITLERADGLLRIRTTPAGAGVTLNGQYQGEAPLDIAVQSGVAYRVQAFSAGYGSATSNVRLASGDERTVTLALERLQGSLVIRAEPAEAELFVNGRPAGSANQTIALPTGRQTIEVRAPGYAGYSTVITPREGISQELRVRLLTLEDARMAALTPEITTRAGQRLTLLRPGPFTMGSSRREPGRRANETLREVNLTRMFYLGRREVTNAEFRRFAPGHDSGSFQDHSLNGDDQPVANITWEEAALYCNWLSEQENLPRFYRTEFGKVIGIDRTATGYRLPTEAEWEWAARQVGAVEVENLRFPWGANLPPPDRHGNYADRSAANLLGRIIFGYNDNHIVSAPVATFAASPIGLHDLSGNVAEWVNDYHEIPGPDPVKDPEGPTAGQYRVIRGSSWMHGTITELRLSFRDYGNGARQDVGFRIARTAEAP
ncbi:MAG: PEGA domain-containing protein [Pseudomonadales bacterium]|nr:PEGA domain-containing protein [Pseudomonadales bacterium]